MAKCLRCGNPSKGFFKLCGRCDQEVTILTERKDPNPPHIEPDDDK